MTFQTQIRQLGMAYFKIGLTMGFAGGLVAGCVLAVVLSVVLK